MKVSVDQGKCQGHARCLAYCPELFEIDDIDGKSRVKYEIVPSGSEARAQRAVDSCPEGAIAVLE